MLHFSGENLMNKLSIKLMNPRVRERALRIDALQITAYPQEARLLEVQHFPPLDGTVEERIKNP
jgi:hypothetical protein